MNKFKTQNSHTGFKPLDNQMNIHSLSSVQGEDLENIDAILERNPTREDKNSLALAIIKTCKLNSNLYPLERLLSSSVSPNLQDPEGKSLLMIASEKGLLELVQILLEDFGADVKMRDKAGKTALFYAIETNNENPDVVSLLLGSGADPNHEAQDRITPLLKAVEKGHYEITKLLLDRGGNIHTTIDSTGDNALHLAVKNGYESIISLLFEHGADLNKKNKKKQTPLDYCQNNPKLFGLLQNLHSSQKVNQSNIIKTVLETPSMPQTYERSDDIGGPTYNEYLNRSEKFRGNNPDQYGRVQNKESGGQDQVNQKKQRNQQQQQQNFENKSRQNENYSSGKDHQGLKHSPPRIRASNSLPVPSHEVIMNNIVPTFDAGNPNIALIPKDNGNGFEDNEIEAQRRQDEFILNNPMMNNSLGPHGFHGMQQQHPNQYKNMEHHRLHRSHTLEEGHGGHIEEDLSQYQPQDIHARKKATSTIMTSQGNEQMDKDQRMQQSFQGNPNEQMHMYPPMVNMKGYPQMKPNMPHVYHDQNQNQNVPLISSNSTPNLPSKNKKQKNQGNIKGGQQNSGYPNMPPGNQGMDPMMAQNPYNFKHPPPNMGYDEQNAPGVLNNQMSPSYNVNNKYNKKGYSDKTRSQELMSPNMRANVNVQGLQPMPGMSPNISQIPNEMQQQMMVNENFGFQEFPNNPNKRPQDPKLQKNQYHNNMIPMHQYPNPPPHVFPDNRNMPNNMLPQNTYMMPPHQYPPQMNDPMVPVFKDPQGHQNIINGIGQTPGPGNFGQPVGYTIPPQNQGQINQMMHKNQFIQAKHPPPPNHPNTNILDNSGMQNQIRTVHLDMNNPLYQRNLKLNADFLSVQKCNRDTLQNLEKTRQENRELKSLIENSKQSEQKLKKSLQEKEDSILELMKKAEDLEHAIRSAAARSGEIKYEEMTTITDPILSNFQIGPMDDLLIGRRSTDFPKNDAVADALHEDIIAFEKYVNAFNQEKKPMFDLLIEHIKEAVGEAVTGAECEIYGSFATGLGLPWSDIDLVLKAPQAPYGTTVLDSLETNLKKQKWVEDVKVIRNTSVPVLKITCAKAYLSKKVDITLYDSRHNGIMCVELVREFITVYPSLRAIVLVLKQFLYTIGLNDTYLGGLSSYGLILMVVYLFQTKDAQRSMEPIEKQNLGSMLLSFLYAFGFEFDYYTHFLVNPRKIPKAGEKQNDMMDSFSLMAFINQNMPSIIEPKIIIQDPLSFNNNVGRSTYQIKEIKNAFMAAYFESLKPCSCEIHRYVTGIDSANTRKQTKCASILKRLMFAYQPTK